jgi:hypothetical protein
VSFRLLYLIFIRIVGWLAQSSTRTFWTTSNRTSGATTSMIHCARFATPSDSLPEVRPTRTVRGSVCFGAPAKARPTYLAIFGLVLADWRTVALLTAAPATPTAGGLIPASSAVRGPTPVSRTGPRISVEADTPRRR